MRHLWEIRPERCTSHLCTCGNSFSFFNWVEELGMRCPVCRCPWYPDQRVLTFKLQYNGRSMLAESLLFQIERVWKLLERLELQYNAISI